MLMQYSRPEVKGEQRSSDLQRSLLAYALPICTSAARNLQRWFHLKPHIDTWMRIMMSLEYVFWFHGVISRPEEYARRAALDDALAPYWVPPPPDSKVGSHVVPFFGSLKAKNRPRAYLPLPLRVIALIDRFGEITAPFAF